MKVDDALETITHFFNDVIGALIPSVVLGVGLVVMHHGLAFDAAGKAVIENNFVAILLVAILFGLGHGLLAVHSDVVEKCLVKMRVVKGAAVIGDPNTQQSFALFKTVIRSKLGNAGLAKASGEEINWAFNDLRNVALSVSNEAASLGRRFMFISLLCKGVGTALLVLTLDFIVCYTFFPKALIQYSDALPIYVQILLLFLSGLLYLRRGDSFHKRAMLAPFSIALTELLLEENRNEKHD